MTDKTIAKIADFILLNAYTTDSIGLYNGKSGIVLALFEASRYLHSEDLENEAFVLFQEVLLNKSEEISFENGWSGVGWSLLYLINNQFIDGDFDEIFNDKYDLIKTKFALMKKRPKRLIDLKKMIYFLIDVKTNKPNDEHIDEVIQAIFEAVELYLSIQFFDINEINYNNNKLRILREFEIYLKLVNYAKYEKISYSLLDYYTDLYNSNRLIKSYYIGYYLEKIVNKSNFNKYKNVIFDNKKDFLQTIHINSLTLQEQIDLLKLKSQKDVYNNNLFVKIKENENEESLESNLLYTMPANTFQASYQYGLSRYLIFNINNKAILL